MPDGYLDWPDEVPHLDAAPALLRIAAGAADLEILCKPRPLSRIRNPDGSSQGETEAERTRRIIEVAVMHLIELGLLVIPDGISGMLELAVPMHRKERSA